MCESQFVFVAHLLADFTASESVRLYAKKNNLAVLRLLNFTVYVETIINALLVVWFSREDKSFYYRSPHLSFPTPELIIVCLHAQEVNKQC